MKFLPEADWINAIAMLPKEPPRVIELPGHDQSTRCYLIEAVSPAAFEAGYRPGDIVICKAVFDLFFYRRTFHRVEFELGAIFAKVPDSLEEFNALDGKTPILQTLAPELIRARKAREAAAAQLMADRRAAGMIL